MRKGRKFNLGRTLPIEQVEEKKEAGMATPTATVSMKLLIDTKAKRVLFAEADKDCVDFLFQILSLPVATIIRLLGAQGMEGSWPSLYQSLETLDHTYIQPDKNKDILLKPVSPVSSCSVPLLALDDEHIGMKFYSCGYCASGHFSDDPRTICPSCNQLMAKDMTYVAPSAVQVAAGGGGIVKGVVTYMVMDDLEVKPMSTISSITLLNKFKVMDVGVLEEKLVHLGINEALKLLKASLRSKTVLTDVFF